MPKQKLAYPFSAIVGQEKVKLALILNAIDPRIGGLLISGAKGTGKSLAVRAFEEILPEIHSVDGCLFNCNPNNISEMCSSCFSYLQEHGTLPIKTRSMRIVQLPLSVTEDRLLGVLDVEAALKTGTKSVKVGLLAEANQNILYIDEVNLLPDYLVNCFLDPSASGWNFIQREGISFEHPSRFILSASMNPEEGELRPQILDRFALHVRASSIWDLKQRMEIVKRNIAFEKDPVGFRERFKQTQEQLKHRISSARHRLNRVTIPNDLFECVANTCSELEVEGCRPDIATIKAARALAAFKGKNVVESEDVLDVYELTISHRKCKRSIQEYLDQNEKNVLMRKTLSKFLGTSLHELDSRFLTEEDYSDSLTGTLTQLDVSPSDESTVRTLTEKDYFGLLDPTFGKRANKRIRGSRTLTFFYPLILLSLFLIFYSSLVSLVPYIYSAFIGVPLEEAGGTALSQLWPYVVVLSLGSFFLTVISKKLHRDNTMFASKTIFYRAYGGKLTRNIVKQIDTPLNQRGDISGSTKEEKEVLLSSSKFLNIPLYASFNKLYNLILNRGPKIAESLKQLRESNTKYKFFLTKRMHRNMGNLIGKRVKSLTSSRCGRYVCYKFPDKKPWDIALVPTIRAAIPFQAQRKHRNLRIAIETQDIRIKMREGRTPLTLLILLDISDSMTGSLGNVRNAIMNLHNTVQKKRDRIGVIVFKGSKAALLQSPTTNLNLIEKKLLEVGTSDFTPLAAGMFEAVRILRNEKMRNKDILPTLVIISDGIANMALEKPLTTLTRSKFLNSAQADAIDVATLLQREKIRTIVINTANDSDEKTLEYARLITTNTGKHWLDSTSFLQEISRITGGYYYGIGEGGEIESTVLMDVFAMVNNE